MGKKNLRDRLKAFIDSKELSIREFERVNDFPNGTISTLSDNITKKRLDTIVENFPTLNTTWLLTGEGSMLKGDGVEVSEDSGLSLKSALQYYPELDVTASNIEGFTDNELNASYKLLNVSGFEGCVGFPVRGDSMLPLMKSGDIVAVERDSVSTIVNGEVYFVLTRDGQRMIKRLVDRGVNKDGERKILCVSDNPDKELYASFEVDGDNILKVLRVRGSLSISLIG